MNLGEIRTELQDLYGNTLTSSASYYNRTINAAYRKLCSLNDWWFLEDTWVLTCRAPTAAFTLSAVQDAATVTAIVPVSTADDFTAFYTARLWVATGTHTYEAITTNTTTNTATLDSEWIEATNATASVMIWKDTYDLPSDCDFVRNVMPRMDPNHMPLRQVTADDIEAFGPDISGTESDFADRYAVFVSPDSTAAAMTKQIRLFPPPSSECEYVVRYSRIPADLSADTDVPYLPEKHHQLLVDMSMLRLLEIEGEDADRIQTFQGEVGFGLTNLKAEQLKRGNVQRRFGRRFYTDGKRPMGYTLKNTAGNLW